MLEPGELVVISGGARGVTAACALELARAVPVTLLLLGRSAPPSPEPEWLVEVEGEAAIKRALLDFAFKDERPSPRAIGEACQQILASREVKANLDALRALGARVDYRQVDLRDRDAVFAVLGEARLAYGPVRGILHGAGVLQDRRIEDKSEAQFQQVYETKVRGLRNLLDATRSHQLKVLALFTSVSGRFGRRGQADYAAANQVLDRVARREALASPGCRVMSLSWGPWDGGMVNAGLKREFDKEGVALIPQQAGARLLVREILSEPTGGVELLVGAGLEPYLEGFPAVEGRTRLALHSISPESHPILNDHRIGGRPVLPLAMMAEWFAEAAASYAPSMHFAGLQDLRVLAGVVFEGETLELEVVARPPHGERAGLTLPLELVDARGRVRARAEAVMRRELELAPAPVLPPMLVDEEVSLPTVDEAYLEQLFHGTGLRAIADIHSISRKGMSLELNAAPHAGQWIVGALHSWALDPLILDGCFQALILWCRAILGHPSLPGRVAAYWQYVTDFPPRVRAVVEIRKVEGMNVTSDVELLDDGGELVARLEGFVCTASAGLEARFSRE
jgi:NAD(P)-dependent dehydrogenase (short-subunit alcohol dehydrogenase family)